MMYDIIIIGGGPGGYKTVELSAKRGMAVLLIEENEIGGTCLNQGCIPFKTYLHITGCADKIGQLQRSGLVNGNACSINQSAVLQNKEAIVSTLRKSVENLLHHLGVVTVKGRATSICSQNDSVVVLCGESSYMGRKAVIATGSKEAPFPLTIPAECDYSIIGSKQMLEMSDIPKRICIVGGGAIGLEAACFFAEAGAEVSVWEAKDTIGGELDTELADALRKCLSKKFSIHTNTTVKEFRKAGIIIKSESSETFVETDCVLLATGRLPNIGMELLQDTGVDYDKNGIVISEDCRTSNPAIYACGDVTGKAMLAHTAYRQAQMIVDSIAGEERVPIHYHLIPKIIYTHPAIFHIGWTEKECAKNGIAYRAKSLPLTYSGKYFAENGKDGAVAKMIVHAQSGEILGFGMIGNGVEEISLAVELMMVNKMNVRQVQHLVFAHPTVGEIIGELAGMF